MVCSSTFNDHDKKRCAVFSYEKRTLIATASALVLMRREDVVDGGVTWRNIISDKLKNVGIGVLNPCNKPTEFAKEDENL